MSDLEFEKIEKLFEGFVVKKNSFFSFENVAKLVFTLVLVILAYAGMSNKVDNTAKDVTDIKQNLHEEKKDNDLQRQTMTIQIQTCQIEIAIMKQKLKDLEEENPKK